MACGDEKCQAVVKAELRVCKAQDVREEIALIMKPYANWEEYLMPAPLSIAILGQLIFISAGKGDFSINNKSPHKDFKYIRYPESFRACLCQVSNEGWHAFNEAHVNMDQIRLLTASIPGRMTLMVETLFQEVDIVQAMLPGQLKSMKSIADKCTTLAQSVKDKYKDVIYLIQELLEVSTNAKTDYERELEEVQIVLQQAKIMEETAKKNMKLAEEYHDKIKKQTDESFDQYKKTMDEVPSGWGAIGMMVVEAFARTAAVIANSASTVIEGIFGSSTNHGPSDGSDTPGSELQNPLSLMTICNFSSMMLSYTSVLKECVVKQDGINLENVHDRKTGQVKSNCVKNGFLNVRNFICGEEDCQPKEKALNICMSGMRICEQLEHMAKSNKTGKEEETAIVHSIEQLYQQAASFDTYSRGILRDPSFKPKPPNIAKYQQKPIGGSVAVQNAHLKVEQSRDMYKQTQEEYQKSFENFKKQNEELAKVLCKMESCKVKEIDFKAALEMLAEGLKAMGKMKEQWEKMIQFFQMISGIIDSCLSKKINDFLRCATDVQQIQGYSSKSFVIDTIYNHVFTASSVSHLVHMIAETYTELSDKYLMDRVSSLGRLLTLQCKDREFNSERNALQTGCEEARQAIYKMVIEKKEEFERNLAARMKVIDTELKAVLPPISPVEKKMIEAAVHDGRKEMTAREKGQFI